MTCSPGREILRPRYLAVQTRRQTQVMRPVVHVEQVVLAITAQSGAGNLLGNLLCAVAHLLDNGGPLHGIAGLLNRILRLFGIR